MAIRRAVILAILLGGGLAFTLGAPTPYRALVVGVVLYILAYVYAELTRPPKGPLR